MVTLEKMSRPTKPSTKPRPTISLPRIFKLPPLVSRTKSGQRTQQYWRINKTQRSSPLRSLFLATWSINSPARLSWQTQPPLTPSSWTWSQRLTMGLHLLIWQPAELPRRLFSVSSDLFWQLSDSLVNWINQGIILYKRPYNNIFIKTYLFAVFV